MTLVCCCLGFPFSLVFAALLAGFCVVFVSVVLVVVDMFVIRGSTNVRSTPGPRHACVTQLGCVARALRTGVGMVFAFLFLLPLNLPSQHSGARVEADYFCGEPIVVAWWLRHAAAVTQ